MNTYHGISWDIYIWIYDVFPESFGNFPNRFSDISIFQVAPEIRRELAAKVGEAGWNSWSNIFTN